MPESRRPELAAIILTGGASRRMGEDKATRLLAGIRAVDRLANLARTVGAEQVITAGGPDLGMLHVPDPAPFSGPVAGIKSVSTSGLTDARRWLILAVDAPTIRPEDLTQLLAASSPGACYEHLPLPMVLWPNFLPHEAENGWPLRRLVEQVGLAQLAPDPDRLTHLRGANTPAEHAALLAAK